MGKLDADLVVAARSEVDLHQGSVLLCPYHFIFQHRFFRSGGAWLYDAGCVAPSVFYKEIIVPSFTCRPSFPAASLFFANTSTPSTG